MADRSFVETVVRLHRLGEGAGYEGLKPSGQDLGAAIPAAEAVVGGADLARLRAVLGREMDKALERRLSEVRTAQRAPVEASGPADVAAVRRRVSAELGFVVFAETLRQATQGGSGHHHE